ncbi:DNA recombination protein RmuC [Alishewanella longhuensis]|uniref:DNA recombination protein RmuC n=1 Tax=Alishewanella longhuensis TaxID=1091037 RepID=A0ABQ3L2V5_9ALTE|nr:DNA recombination protein RmuC [Alishewanella longhuensis]GHG77435.1 DNA recombination protein RmuC [Alishewanella longhuensis]
MTTLDVNVLLGFALATVIGLLLGYLAARLLQKPQWSRLHTELLTAQQQLATQHEMLQHSRLAAGKLEEKHAFSESNINRLQEEVVNYKTELKQLHLALAEESKKAQHYETTLNEQEKQYQGLLEQYQGGKSQLEALQQEHSKLTNHYTALKTSLAERDASHQRELANFEKQKQSLVEQFKTLSNDILEAKAQSLQESSKATLNTVITPFQQSIEAFKKEVQDIHHRETTAQGELKKELESLKLLNQQITQEAHELSTALRGQKKLQGNWGELVLENVLERSGLQLGRDYEREVSFTTEEGKFRPDAIVYLPQNKHLVIDAKVSLNAYSRYVNAEHELERQQALKEHVYAIGSRIKELSAKDYFRLPGLNSPDMVFMFIPIESAFVEALKADENLFQQAISNNILVATPTTLLTSLNIVRQLWRYEDQNKHTAALADKAETVFKKLNSFLGSFEKIKRGLDTASQAYSAAENQLISGRGNLVKQVADFKNLAPAIKAELPQYFVEKAELEIDFVAASNDEQP